MTQFAECSTLDQLANRINEFLTIYGLPVFGNAALRRKLEEVHRIRHGNRVDFRDRARLRELDGRKRPCVLRFMLG